MSEGMREDVERQLARLLDEAERPMRVEEILPHLDPVMPHPNDVADILQDLAQKHRVEREGSFFHKPTPVPLDNLFSRQPERELAAAVIEIIRELDKLSEGDGARTRHVLREATARGHPADRVLDVVAILRNAGEAYSVGGDRIRLAKM